jgi:hypothetical protein
LIYLKECPQTYWKRFGAPGFAAGRFKSLLTRGIEKKVRRPKEEKPNRKKILKPSILLPKRTKRIAGLLKKRSNLFPKKLAVPEKLVKSHPKGKKLLETCLKFSPSTSFELAVAGENS